MGGSGLGGSEIASLQLHVDEDIAAHSSWTSGALLASASHRHDRR
jgi:hypothetical protein